MARSAGRGLLGAAAGVTLVAFVAVIGVGAVAGPADETSTMDGRRLATFPDPSAESIKDGTWMTGAEAWMDDHVPGRARWLDAHGTMVTRGLQAPVVNDVLVDDPQGVQLERLVRLRVPARLGADAEGLGQAVRRQGVPLLWVYVPRKEEVFADRLPKAWDNDLLRTKPQVVSALERGGPVLDLTDALAHPSRREQYFWRTDHHWSPKGAIRAVDAIAERARGLGVQIPADERTYTDQTYWPTFYGSTARKATAGATRRPDVFTVSQPPSWRARSCVQDRCETPTFVTSLATARDLYANRYAAFMGGDYGFQRVHNDDPAARGTVLLIKDSLGDAVSTYLAERVTDLITIDERHYRGKEIRDVVATYRPDLVIVLHNQLTLLGNKQFSSRTWVDVQGALRTKSSQGDG